MTNKILVVDDEPDFCEALCEFLADRGFAVMEANSCDEALAAYKQERPDVVLLDMRMPVKDGLATLRELMAIDSKASVIIVTAVHDQEVVKQATAEGATYYISKPVDMDHSLDLLTKGGLLGAENPY